jgi:N1221-like protein
MFSNDIDNLNKDGRDDDKEWDLKWFDDEMIESSAESGTSQELGIVKADEVDEIGALARSSATSDTQTLDPNRDVFGDGGSVGSIQGGGVNKNSIMLPQRPQFPRVEAQGRPPFQPPPSPQGPQQQSAGAPADSLSLLQLRRLVSDMPKYEPAAYTFVYQDSASFPEELEEWFTYSEEEQNDNLYAKATFEKKWGVFIAKTNAAQHSAKWIDTDISKRRRFVESEVAGLESVNSQQRGECLECLVYVGLGIWGETAGLASVRADTRTEDTSSKAEGEEAKGGDIYECAGLQMDWMMQGAELIYEAMGVPAVFDVLRGACLRSWLVEPQKKPRPCE